MPSIDKLLEGYEKAQNKYLSYGITTLQEGYMSKELLPLYKALIASKKLKVDVVEYPDYASIEEFKNEFPKSYKEYNEHFKIDGLKMILDGSPQGRTAWMKEPYEIEKQDIAENKTEKQENIKTKETYEEEEYKGYLAMKYADIVRNIKYAKENNLQILAHCNGDAAAEEYIKACKEVGNVEKLRPVIIHAQLITKEEYFIYFNDYDRDNFNLFDKVIGNVVPGSNGVISDDAFVVLNNWAANNIFKDSPYETFNALFNYVNSNFDRETARNYVIEYTKSQNIGGTLMAILFGVMVGLFGTMIISAIFFDAITPKCLISSASKKAEKYNRVYESVKQYRLIKDGVISLDKLETSESLETSERDTDENKNSKLSFSKDNTNSNNTDNSVSLSILNDIKAKVLFRFDTDGRYVDTANKIEKLKEILENTDEVKDTNDSDATIISKVNWFCRRYGKIIIDSGNAIYKLDNPLSRSEKADRLLKYVAISIDSIYDTKVASSETEVDISLNTIENLMKLDGLN